MTDFIAFIVSITPSLSNPLIDCLVVDSWLTTDSWSIDAPADRACSPLTRCPVMPPYHRAHRCCLAESQHRRIVANEHRYCWCCNRRCSVCCICTIRRVMLEIICDGSLLPRRWRGRALQGEHDTCSTCTPSFLPPDTPSESDSVNKITATYAVWYRERYGER